MKPLACSKCPANALGTGTDGNLYCHLCRNWKLDRYIRLFLNK